MGCCTDCQAGNSYIIQMTASNCLCEEKCSDCFDSKILNLMYVYYDNIPGAGYYVGSPYVCGVNDPGDIGTRCDKCTFTGTVIRYSPYTPSDTKEFSLWPPGHTGNSSSAAWRLYDVDAKAEYFSTRIPCNIGNPVDVYETAGGVASDWEVEDLD